MTRTRRLYTSLSCLGIGALDVRWPFYVFWAPAGIIGGWRNETTGVYEGAAVFEPGHRYIAEEVVRIVNADCLNASATLAEHGRVHIEELLDEVVTERAHKAGYRYPPAQQHLQDFQADTQFTDPPTTQP